MVVMYLSAFFIGKGNPVANGFVLTGAAIGGIGSGYLWTAQGAYFQQCARRYALFSGREEGQVTGEFSSLFAATFLFFETGLKLTGGAIQNKSTMGMYLVFTIVGVLSALGMSTIQVRPLVLQLQFFGGAVRSRHVHS
jgi:hypothetical protein